ncbi:MAG: hypothetical protein P4L31_00910, partial [Candidatus Babeliales bacterium]|nr:hypothetical protein [Candidatus Babeliales bacterium]
MKKIVLIALIATQSFGSANQTADLTPVLVNKPLPFSVSLQLADFTVPGGIHSAAAAQYGSEVLYIAGRTNGLHGFSNTNDNFPPLQQNTNVIVINLHTKKVTTRSLHDPLSGLTQQQIDTLSVTSPQSYQCGKRLYITGGYGVVTGSTPLTFSTKDTLSSIDVPGLIHWVTHPDCPTRASKYIRQISNPVFQVTGGAMYQAGKDPTLLMFGQNFVGAYTGPSNGVYTQQVRRFRIIDNGNYLGVIVCQPTQADTNFRRRDLNVVPMIKVNHDKKKIAAFVALSGVFTPDTGVWTVPVEICANGNTFMADPTLPTTFKQGMNNYVCPHAELLAKSGSMYTILFGGLTFEYFQDGEFLTDPEIPFTNNITVVKRNRCGLYEQY